MDKNKKITEKEYHKIIGKIAELESQSVELYNKMGEKYCLKPHEAVITSGIVYRKKKI